MGVVIGETAEVGSDVTLYHGVTLGGTSLNKGKRHPTIGDRVTIGAGAKVLGNITIGSDSRIGANAVVVRSVPENSVVVGVPGQVVHRVQPHRPSDAPDLNHTSLPDVVGVTLQDLLQRVDEMEARVKGHDDHHHIHAPRGWRLGRCGFFDLTKQFWYGFHLPKSKKYRLGISQPGFRTQNFLISACRQPPKCRP